jgi:putative transposase
MPARMMPENSSPLTTWARDAQADLRFACVSTRGRMSLKPGTEVAVGARPYRISHILDFETILAHDLQTGEVKPFKISELVPVIAPSNPPQTTGEEELMGISEAMWQIAQARFSMIRPLLLTPRCTLAQVRERAETAGVNHVTVYRWLRRYRRSGRLSSLLPAERRGGQGHSRLAPDVEAIVHATIEEIYLSEQKASAQQTCVEVHRRCRNAGLTPPHPNTIRHRIRHLSDHVRLRRREGARAGVQKYAPLLGAFPGADRPLAVVQVDHTPVDLILVDDLHRRPVGRPWITVAIDVFSRMIAGFYVSFDPPGAMAVGLCLAHAILPKETWLAKHEIATPWPVWGLMDVVHADNAKEFHSRMLQRACDNYGIDLRWRPVARPHYGGHIERLLGTFNHDIHALPGTTFSNPANRGTYEVDQKAALTLSEFERWLTIYITEIYHQRVHRGLGTPPIARYTEGIFGTADRPGRGLPDRLLDEARLRLDLMPYEERTVQRNGITIDEICYYDNVLRPWIRAADPTDPRGRRPRKFIVRRDPRDISTVYFYDPDLKQHFAIPYRHTAYPPISVWELREARRRLKAEGHKVVNDALIFDAYTRLRALEDEAIRDTKKARRAAQQRRVHGQMARPTCSPARPSLDGPVDDLDDIQPFDEIEELDG